MLRLPLRLRRDRGPRARLTRLRAVPLAALSIWLSIGLVATLALLDLVARRVEQAQDQRDMVWASILHREALKTELARPARGMLDHALDGSDPARIDWRQPADAGLLVAIDDGSGFRLLSRPPGIDAAAEPLPRLVRSLQDTREPVPTGESYCLPLPEADVARISRALSLRRGAKVVAAACFGTESIGRAAHVALPRSGELTFWRDRRGLVRVSKGQFGELKVGAAPAALASAVPDREGEGIELSQGPFAALDLLVRGGSTVGNLQVLEEERAGDTALVYYVGGPRKDGSWSGFSFTFGDSPPKRSPLAAWTAGLLALHVALVPLLAFWTWRVVGRLTRRWQPRG